MRLRTCNNRKRKKLRYRRFTQVNYFYDYGLPETLFYSGGVVDQFMASLRALYVKDEETSGGFEPLTEKQVSEIDAYIRAKYSGEGDTK